MRTIAYCALHYGADYLGYAIRSVIDHVDQFIVAYTDVGSHGHRTALSCPDSMETLYEIARRAAGDKLLWHANRWDYEGQQRDFAVSLAEKNDADVILVVDSDEIWPENYAGIVASGVYWGIWHEWRLPMIHYWRSFYKAVLHDPAYPIRAINPSLKNVMPDKRTTTANLGDALLYLNHMGYAQRSEIVKYKLLTHGHKNEFRQDVDWFNDVFMANRQHDCHPVGSEYWTPEAVNPLDYMPEFMQKHPYYKLDVIP